MKKYKSIHQKNIAISGLATGMKFQDSVTYFPGIDGSGKKYKDKRIEINRDNLINILENIIQINFTLSFCIIRKIHKLYLKFASSYSFKKLDTLVKKYCISCSFHSTEV